MDDSFKKGLEAIKAETPVSVKADPISLLYGIVFVVLGVWLFGLDSVVFGLLAIVVGLIGILGGAATFFWRSPKVKIIQAVDSFAIALLLLVFMIWGSGGDFFDSPLPSLALGGFMVWVGFSDLKEYRRLREIQKGRTNMK
jgi:fatty acid desaturase